MFKRIVLFALCCTSLTLRAKALDGLGPEQKILIACVDINGLGDVIAAKKLVRDLVERSHIAPERIILTGNDGARRKFAIHSPYAVQITARDKIDFTAVGLQIVIPSIEGKDYLDFTRAPVVTIEEHNHIQNNDALLTWTRNSGTGVRSREQFPIGIQLEPTKAASRSDLLNQLPESLRAIAKVTQEKGGKLYFGHTDAPEAWFGFVKSILNTGKITGPTVFMTGKQFDPKAFMELLPSGADIRLVFKPVTHEESLILQQLSEPETIVTGDQSLNEAISFNKHWVYEALEHKASLRKAIDEKASRINKSLPLPTLELSQYDSIASVANILSRTFSNLQDDFYGALNNDLRVDYYPRVLKLISKVLEQKPALSALNKVQHLSDFVAGPTSMPHGVRNVLSTDQVVAMRIDNEGQLDPHSPTAKVFPKNARFEVSRSNANTYFVRWDVPDLSEL